MVESEDECKSFLVLKIPIIDTGMRRCEIDSGLDLLSEMADIGVTPELADQLEADGVGEVEDYSEPST